MKRYSTFFIVVLATLLVESKAQISFTDPISLTEDNNSVIFQAYSPFNNADIKNDGYDDLILLSDTKIKIRENSNGLELGEEQLLYQHNAIMLGISNFTDINKDGFLDFAIVSNDSIHVLYGNGNGFEKKYSMKGLFTYYGKIILMDFNNDGDIDIVTDSDYKIFLNKNWRNDPSAFESIFSYRVGNEALTSFEFFEIEESGKWGLVANTTEKVRVYNIDEIGFELKFIFDGPHEAQWDIGDLNLDGFNDLVISMDGGDIFSFIYNETTKSYDSTNTTKLDSYHYYHGPALIDIDGNNSLDVVFHNNHDLFFQLNDAQGNLAETSKFTDLEFAQGSVKNIVFDFNNDGNSELLRGGYEFFDILFFEDHHIQKQIHHWYLPTYFDIKSDDLDEDSFVDLVCFNYNGSIDILWGSADGGYSEKTEIPISHGTNYGYITDLDGDGSLDILCSNYGIAGLKQTIIVVKGMGNRTFSASAEWKVIDSTSKIHEIDSDLDNKYDFLVHDRFGSEIYRFERDNTDLYEKLDIGKKITVTGSHINNIEVADINGDNYPDILAACRNSKNIIILKNDQSGGFTETTIDLVNEPWNIVSIDYNQDGLADLAFTERDTNFNSFFKIFIQTEEQNFVYEAVYNLENNAGPNEIDIIDIDGNGDLEIIVSDYAYSNSQIFEQGLDSLYLLTTNVLSINNSESRNYVELNGDNKVDVVQEIYPGYIISRYNNSVVKPTKPTLLISFDTIKYDGLTILFEQLNTSGAIVSLKEGVSNIFNPEIGKFYTHNTAFGIGASAGDNTYVVYSGEDTVIEITGLQSNTTYELSVFEYNSNLPDNTIINYGSEGVVSTFTTKKAIFELQIFPDTIKIDEDSILTIDLSEYINDYGENAYMAFNENSKVSTSLNGSIITITPNQDYFGLDTIGITASLPTETFQTGFHLEIISVNDPPVISPIEETVVVTVDTPGKEEALTIEYIDPDDSSNGLRVEVSSSNLDVVADADIQVEVKEDAIVITYNSSGYGISTITIIIIDEMGEETRMSFNLEVTKIMALDDLEISDELYPNPTSGLIKFRTKTNEKSTAVLYSMTGEIVLYNIRIISDQLDLSGVSPGVYLLRFNMKDYKIVME